MSTKKSTEQETIVTVQEQYSEEQIQDAIAAITDEEVREMERPYLPTTIEDVHVDDEVGVNDKAVTLHTDNTLVFAEGLAIQASASDEEIDAMVELVQSYVGVKPEKVGNRTGEWMLAIGCALVPFEREMIRKSKEINPDTGEVFEGEYSVTKKWKAPLFKLAEINKQGQHVILSGGGGNAVDFVKRYAGLGRAGDWKTPKEIMFSSEEREIEDEHGVKKPGRMYRIDIRTPQGKA
jgi:hypothetical protein